MAGFMRTIVIDRPIEEVFDFATDLNNASKVMPNVTKVEMLTAGSMKPGAKFKETRLMNGKERSMVIEVVEHARPSVHAARARMMGMVASFTFRFFAEGAGTRVEMDAVHREFPVVAVPRHDEPDDGKGRRRIPQSSEGRPRNLTGDHVAVHLFGYNEGRFPFVAFRKHERRV